MEIVSLVEKPTIWPNWHVTVRIGEHVLRIIMFCLLSVLLIGCVAVESACRLGLICWGGGW